MPASLSPTTIRGVRPLLGSLDYSDDEQARSGQRFYLLESRPLSEWSLIAETGSVASRVIGSLDALTPTEDEHDGE